MCRRVQSRFECAIKMWDYSDSSMRTFLEENHSIESEMEAGKRRRAVEAVESTFQEWLRSKFSPHVRGSCLILGSVKLKTHGSKADTDILLIVPRPVSRSACFLGLYDAILQTHHSDISWSRKIESTFIPVFKIRFDGVDLDIAVSQLPTNDIDMDLMNDSVLKGMDGESVRCLNGYRDSMIIIRMVEAVHRMSQFRLALILIKLWAQRRGIYNNSAGYLSGMGLMVLLTRVFLENPDLESAWQYVKTFFVSYSQWPWPRPVQLGHIEANDPGAPVLQVWNPMEYKFDKEHKLPIITPAYPQRNSTFTATRSTSRVIKDELKRAATVFNGKDSLEKLVEPTRFFDALHFKYYIVIRAASSADLENHLDWCAVARSQIRKLIGALEQVHSVLRLHFWPNAYPTKDHVPKSLSVSANFQSQWFIGLDLSTDENIEFIADYIKKYEENVVTYARDHGVSSTGSSASGFLALHGKFQSMVPDGIGAGVAGFTLLQEVRKGFFQ